MVTKQALNLICALGNDGNYQKSSLCFEVSHLHRWHKLKDDEHACCLAADLF